MLQDGTEQRKALLVLLAKECKSEMEITFARRISFAEIGYNGILDGIQLSKCMLWKEECIKESHGISIHGN